MNLRRKNFPVLAGFMISILFFSCTGGPETTEIAQSDNSTEIKKDEPAAKEELYETSIVDLYKVSRESYFLDDGSANGYKDYFYNEEGFLTGKENYKGSGELLFEEKYINDEEGRVLKSELYDSEGLTSYTAYVYDEEGMLVSEEYYNHKDVFLSGSRFEYDKRGRKVLWESLDENKTLVLKAEYIYKGDDLIKVGFLTPLNKEDGSIDYIYNGGVVAKEISINGAGKEERRREYEYAGETVDKEKIYQLGRLSRVNEMEYDEAGNLVEMVTYNRSQKLIGHTEYEYVTFQDEKQVLVQ